MKAVLVDPIIIVAPPQDSSRETIEAWLKQLMTWLAEALYSPHQWFHTMSILRELLDYDLLLTYEKLAFWQRRFGSDGLEIDIPLILRYFDEFVSEEREFESALQHDLQQVPYAIEAQLLAIYPAEFTARWPDTIQVQMSSTLALACAGKAQALELAHALCIATKALEISEREIRITATMSLLSADGALSELEVAQVFPLLFSPEDLPALLDILELWNRGEQGIRYAIDQRYKSYWKSLHTLPLHYSFGEHFLESVYQAGLDTQEFMLNKIVKAIVDVIADQAKNVKGYKLHPLRANIAGDSKQMTRETDGAKCWRVDLTLRGAGWRMHYWSIPTAEGPLIEFINVCKESQTQIF